MFRDDELAFLVSLMIKRQGKATLRLISEDVERMGLPISHRRLLAMAHRLEAMGIVDKPGKKPICIRVRWEIQNPLTTILETAIREGKTI